MDDSIDMDGCWEFVKYFLNNLADIWTKADLSLKQKLKCLISPEGFYFEEKIIKHVKTPYFISIFCSKTRDFKKKGQVKRTLLTECIEELARMTTSLNLVESFFTKGVLL